MVFNIRPGDCIGGQYIYIYTLLNVQQAVQVRGVSRLQVQLLGRTILRHVLFTLLVSTLLAILHEISQDIINRPSSFLESHPCLSFSVLHTRHRMTE